jgi:hypothetical protein
MIVDLQTENSELRRTRQVFPLFPSELKRGACFTASSASSSRGLSPLRVRRAKMKVRVGVANDEVVRMTAKNFRSASTILECPAEIPEKMSVI